MTLSQLIGELETAKATGSLEGRDLEVIERQVARAEAKILRALASRGALCPTSRRVFTLSEAEGVR